MPKHNAPPLIWRVVDEIWNQGKLDLVDVLFTADYVNHGGLIPDLVHGPEAVKFAVAFYRLAFPHHQIVIDSVIEDADHLSVAWTALERMDRGSASEAATLTGGITVRVLGAQIAESWMRWDADEVLPRLAMTATPSPCRCPHGDQAVDAPPRNYPRNHLD